MTADNILNLSRRNALKLAALAGMAGAVSSAASAQETTVTFKPAERPMPTVDARYPAEMAPGVFLIPDRRIPLVPNIGIIVGTETVLVVDCGLGIDSAENVLRLTRELAPGRKIILTVTHAHPEHGFGAQVFQNDARIFYNSSQRDYLQRSGQALLEGFRAGALPEGQKHLLNDIILTPPHETYDTEMTAIDLGGRTAHLKSYGTAHSPGDQIIFLPQEGILFSGDLIEERMFPIVPLAPPMIAASDINLVQWEAALNDIIAFQPRMIVPGHGNLGAPEISEAVLDYFHSLRIAAQSQGTSDDDVQRRLRDQYATWEHPQFIGPAVSLVRQAG